jgi:hypothetical protein
METKTEQEIQSINQQRALAIDYMLTAQLIFKQAECSLGADIIDEAIREIINGWMNEY